MKEYVYEGRVILVRGKYVKGTECNVLFMGHWEGVNRRRLFVIRRPIEKSL